MSDIVGISVIIPVYNARDMVARAVGSVCMQDFDSYEIILVDDGSTDGSGKTCEELASEHECIRVIHKQNGGVSSARNAGLDAAHGEYVMFLDADDAIRDGSLSMMYARDCDLVLGGFEKLKRGNVTESHRPREERTYFGDSDLCTFFDRNISRKHCSLFNSSCFKLYRRSLIREHGIRFDESLHYGEDKIFVMTFLCHVQKVRTIPSVTYSYILQEGSLSSDETSDRHLKQIFMLMKQYEPLLEKLGSRFSSSARISDLYHIDMVCRYALRILTQFAVRRSELLTKENIALVYEYMSKDRKLSVTNVRIRQIPNIILFWINSPGFSKTFYRLISKI